MREFAKKGMIVFALVILISNVSASYNVCEDYSGGLECSANTLGLNIFTSDEWTSSGTDKYRINGAGCFWSIGENECYNKMVIDFANSADLNCYYVSEVLESCENLNAEFLKISQSLSTSSAATCGTYFGTKTLPCSSQVKLPFFTWKNFVMSLLAIAIIYGFIGGSRYESD